MSSDVVLLLSAEQLLLGVTICAFLIRVRVARRLRREQQFRIRLAIMEEQAHIARELHDVVAHHLTVIVAGASAAKRVSAGEETASVLGSIEMAGRDALIEMRRILGRLHAEQDDAPPPGLDQLPTLLARVEQAGLPVRLTVQGDRPSLPDGVELNAYRIIQEALTNALKHAGPTRANVMVGYRPGSLLLRIHDQGRGGPPGFLDGYGLTGMRRRAAQLGGDIAVGPGPDGGFRVVVNLPVKAA
jgi:signal transduction histidine kinase